MLFSFICQFDKQRIVGFSSLQMTKLFMCVDSVEIRSHRNCDREVLEISPREILLYNYI